LCGRGCLGAQRLRATRRRHAAASLAAYASSRAPAAEGVEEGGRGCGRAFVCACCAPLRSSSSSSSSSCISASSSSSHRRGHERGLERRGGRKRHAGGGGVTLWGGGGRRGRTSARVRRRRSGGGSGSGGVVRGSSAWCSCYASLASPRPVCGRGARSVSRNSRQPQGEAPQEARAGEQGAGCACARRARLPLPSAAYADAC
jgi:hypothetical protein